MGEENMNEIPIERAQNHQDEEHQTPLTSEQLNEMNTVPNQIQEIPIETPEENLQQCEQAIDDQLSQEQLQGVLEQNSQDQPKEEDQTQSTQQQSQHQAQQLEKISEQNSQPLEGNKETHATETKRSRI